MADGEREESRGGNPGDQEVPHRRQSEPPQAEIRMELVDSLPGGRAVVVVEQEDAFVWLASKEHVTEQACDEFVEQLVQIARERSWVQNWPGAR